MLVRKPVRQLLFILLTAALALAACNIGATPAPPVDVSAINTAAFNTAVAQISAAQTQTALAAPSTPTNTPLSLPTSGSASPSANASALPTLSFNTSPNTTPLAGTTPFAGFTPVGSPGVPVQSAATAVLGDACSNNQFIADITIPDGTVFEAGTDYKPGHEFQKIWRVKNTGTCKWDEGFALVWIAGDQALKPYTFKLKDPSDFVGPGETADLGVTLWAPSAAGKYTATWRMQNDHGYFFGTPLTVMIEVRKH